MHPFTYKQNKHTCPALEALHNPLLALFLEELPLTFLVISPTKKLLMVHIGFASTQNLKQLGSSPSHSSWVCRTIIIPALRHKKLTYIRYSIMLLHKTATLLT